MTEKTGKTVIFFNKEAYTNQMLAAETHVEVLQDVVNLWKELTGTELKTNELPTVLTGSLKQLKELAFDKLANKNTKDATLFGMRIKKDKALDMLDVPDISAIIQERQRIFDEVVALHNSQIPIEYVNLKSGKISCYASYGEKAKEGATIYAETPEEEERAGHILSIKRSWEILLKKELIDPATGRMEKYLNYNSMIKQFAPNYTAIKTGRVY